METGFTEIQVDQHGTFWFVNTSCKNRRFPYDPNNGHSIKEVNGILQFYQDIRSPIPTSKKGDRLVFEIKLDENGNEIAEPWCHERDLYNAKIGY